MSKDSVVKVFTRNPFEEMVRRGGSGYWVTKASRITNAQYVVCVRNGRGLDAADDVEPGTAFLVGKVSGVELYGDPSERRFLLRLSKYKRINVPNSWDGSQNPVRYLSLEEAEEAFGSFSEGGWKTFPQPTEVNKRPGSVNARALTTGAGRSPVRGLTITEAKAGLALKLGIDESQIEIIIRS